MAGQEGIIYPVDHVGGEYPIAAFGTRRLRKAYEGPAISVTNPRTFETTSIMFLRDGDIDRQALTFAMHGATHLEVATVYDQCGNNDLSQNSSENRPVISADITLANSIPIIFDGCKQGKKTDKFLNIPETVATVDGQPTAQVAVVSFRDTAQDQGISTLNRNQYNLSWGYSASSDIFFTTIYNTNISLKNPAPITPFVAGYCETKNGTMIWLDEDIKLSGHKYRGKISGGTVGRLWASAGGYVELSCLLIYGRLFQNSDHVGINKSLKKTFGIAPDPRAVLVCDGDSITEGYGGTLNQTYPRQLMSMLNRPFRIYNTGSFGQRSKQRLSYLEKRWTKFFPDVLAENILVEFSGVNDLSANLSAKEIYENLTHIVNQANSNGIKVILVTIPPSAGFKSRGSPPGQLEAERLALNLLIRENSAGAYGIADIASHPKMGAYENLAVKDYYLDQIHPATLGLRHIAEVVAAAINDTVPAPA